VQVEREEHCKRCSVTSPGVTGWKLPRTGWQSITVELRSIVCAVATTLCVTERDNQEAQEALASEAL